MPVDHHPSDAGDEPVVVTRRQLDALLALQARVDQLEGSRPVAPAPTPAPTAKAAKAAPTAPADLRVGRRRAIAGLAGAAAVGTVAALAPGTPAAADDGDPLELGSVENTATAPTYLTVTGESVPAGFGVIDNDPGGELVQAGALFAHAGGDAFGTALRVTATGGAQGVFVRALGGGAAGFFVSEDDMAPGLFAGSDGYGVMAAGPKGQVHLTPETPSPVAFPAARTGTIYVQAGQDEESFVDGTLWACVEDGSPGRWRKLAGHDTAGALHILPSPHRVYDSRPNGIPLAVGPKTPLPAGNVARTLDLKAAWSGVPAGATGALVTVLLVNASVGGGNFTIWANDRPKPTGNTLVWGGNAGRFTTLAVTALDAQARVKVDASLQTNVVLDVVGYYR